MTDSQTIAEELSSKQREISVAEFFEQNRQMLGFGSEARAMVTAVKEGVDNAIDAAEDAQILPHVRVHIQETEKGYYKLTITDNGPGITKENVPKVFGKLLYGSRFSKRVQRRGQQGIGISAAVLYGQLTTGKPAEVISKVKEHDQGEYFKVGINTDTNNPKIQESKPVEWSYDSSSGTSITVYLEATFRARQTLHEYIKHTAIVNPHATIELNEPEKQVLYERTVDTLPKQPTEINPHPHGIEFGTLRSLIEVTDSHSISGFLQSEFTRVGETTANKIIDRFMDLIKGRYLQWETLPTDAAVPTRLLSTSTPRKPNTERETGEQTSTDPPEETITLIDHITASINRKPEGVTNEIAQRITTTLTEKEEVSWRTVDTVVTRVCEDITTEFDVTLGDTVRQNIRNATWEFIRITRVETLTKKVDSNTSDRKSTEDSVAFATQLTRLIDSRSDSTDAITESELRELISDASKKISVKFGETAQENVFEAIWETTDRTQKDPPLLRKLDSDRALASSLHAAMQSVDVMAPPSKCLSPIGEEELVKGMKKVYESDFYSSSTRNASAHSGDPFLIEAGIAYGGDLESQNNMELLRFANRVPLVYQQGACSITRVISNIRWNNYKLSHKGNSLPQGPVAAVVHIASTNVPFTSESKDAVAAVEVIEDEIERAIRDVSRDLKRYLSEQQSLKKRRRKQDVIAELLPEFSKQVSTILGKQVPDSSKSLAQIMNNVFVSVSESSNTNECTVTAYNFDNSTKQSPSVRISLTGKPELNQSLDYVLTSENDTWVIEWQPSLGTGDETSLTLPIQCSNIDEVTVENLPEEKVITT